MSIYETVTFGILGTETLGLNGIYPFQRGSVYNFFLSRLAPATFPLSCLKGEAELLGRGPGSGVSRLLQRHCVMAALCLCLLPKNVDFPGCPGRGVKSWEVKVWLQGGENGGKVSSILCWFPPSPWTVLILPSCLCLKSPQAA